MCFLVATESLVFFSYSNCFTTEPICSVHLLTTRQKQDNDDEADDETDYHKKCVRIRTTIKVAFGACWCGLLPVEQVGTHDSFCAAKIHTGAPEEGTYGNWKRNPKKPPECQRSGKGSADPFTSHNNITFLTI